MDRIEQLWVLLSSASVPCCHEPDGRRETMGEPAVMDPDLFGMLTAKACAREWQCTIVADAQGVPQVLREQLDPTVHRIVVPADCEAEAFRAATSVVYNCHQTCSGTGFAGAQAILRVAREDLPKLASCIIELLQRHTGVALRHPDLLKYSREDLETYRRQLHDVGEWLLGRGAAWPDSRVDVLTDRFRLSGPRDCGAGDRSLAVGPDGSLYLCPAAFRQGHDPCGHISRGVELANRQLFTRDYALPCRETCSAWHCLRCVFLNKLATYEVNVPAENMCQLAHVELAVQAWFANAAIERQCWDGRQGEVPAPPIIDDPFQLVKVTEEIPEAIWQRLLMCTERPEDLSPPMMLGIIYGLQGKLDAILSCVQAGYVVPSALIRNDVLLSLRRKTIEKYKDIVFQEGCPTVGEIELLLDEMVEVLVERSSASPQESPRQRASLS